MMTALDGLYNDLWYSRRYRKNGSEIYLHQMLPLSTRKCKGSVVFTQRTWNALGNLDVVATSRVCPIIFEGFVGRSLAARIQPCLTLLSCTSMR